MAAEPLISVILPTYNRPRELLRAVTGVLAQTYRGFELIVVDDQSSVPARALLSDITDARLQVLRHDRNGGAPEARNTGIRQARGAFIALLDDDDEFLPDCLEKLLAKMAVSPPGVGVVHGGIRFVGPSGELMREQAPRLRGDIRGPLLRGEKDSNVMGLVRRECFERAGLFDTTLASCQDWDMWLRISAFYEFDHIPDIVVVYHSHPLQLSRDLAALIKGRTRMVEKHRALFARDPRILAIHLKRLGKLHALNGSWKDARRWFGEAATLGVREPFLITAWLLWEYPRARWFSPARDLRRMPAGEMT